MFDFFQRNSDKIQVITYQDIFSESDDYNYREGYPTEKSQWLNGIKANKIDASKAYVLLQYDIDSQPQRTMDLLNHPSHENVPANIMRFAQRVDRRLLKTTDKLEYTEYPLDTELLNRLCKKRFLVGYHSNCYERSHHDNTLAPQILEQDIQSLQKEHDISFYTAHGGIPCQNKKNNRDVIPLEKTAEQVRWVHNGATPFFNKQFSDGGHNSPLRDPIDRDLRDFIRNIEPGGRYRILIHPQYYANNFSLSKRYSGTSWYDSMAQETQNNEIYDSWQDVKLANFDKPQRATQEKKQNRQKSRIINFVKRKLKTLLNLVIRKHPHSK